MNPGILTSGYRPPPMPYGLLGSPRAVPTIDSFGFDPRSIPSLGMWYDASVASSVTLNGSNVSQINDLSGSERRLLQATAASQPAYVTAARNGKNVMRFTASHSLQFNNANTGSAYTVTSQSIFFALFPTTAAVNSARVFSQTIAGQNDFSGTGHFIPTYYASNTQLSVYANSAVQASILVTAGQAVIVSCVHSGSSFNHRVNRGSLASGTSALNTTFANFGLGVGGSAVPGDFCEFVIYNNRACTEAERTAVERYLAAKWGIAVA